MRKQCKSGNSSLHCYVYLYFPSCQLYFQNLNLALLEKCIGSYSSPYFPVFGLNTDQNSSEYGHFLSSVIRFVRLLVTEEKATIILMFITSNMVLWLEKYVFTSIPIGKRLSIKSIASSLDSRLLTSTKVNLSYLLFLQVNN